MGALFSFLVSVIPGLASVIGNTIVKNNQTEASRQRSENTSGLSLAMGWLQSVNEVEKIKADHQTERQIVFALLGFALPTAIHWWFVLMDSVPFYIPYLMTVTHKVGSWGIAAPPGRWADAYFRIIDSFFIAAPAIVGVKMLADAFRRDK